MNSRHMERIPIFIDVQSEVTRSVLEAVLGEAPEFAEAMSPAPDGLLVRELRTWGGAGVEAEIAEVMECGSEVFLVASQRDPDTLLRSMRAGVREFLLQPLGEDEVLAALKRYAGRRQARSPGSVGFCGQSLERTGGRSGAVVDVVGARCGAGVTTLAANLAASLAGLPETPAVALVDLNVGCGEAALFLNIKPRHDWGEAIRAGSRLDDSFLSGLLGRGQEISLLSAPLRLECQVEKAVDTVLRILTLARFMFDLVIVDGGDYADELAVAVMEASDTVLFVAPLSLPYLAQAGRFLDRSGRASGKVRVVANRCLRDPDLSDEDIRLSLGREVWFRLPEDYRAAQTAANHGLPIAKHAPRSPLGRALRELAGRLAQEHGLKADRRRFLDIFGRFGRNKAVRRAS